MKGSTYRRCYCRDENGKVMGKSCPQLSSRRHGVWAVRQELPPREDGTRRSERYIAVRQLESEGDQPRSVAPGN